jgi:hypothetical protein
MSSTNWREASKEVLETFYKNKAKLNNLAGLTAVQSLQANQREQQANQEAESQWVRKNLWGSDVKAGEDDMGTTILGDITHPAPIIMPPTPQSNIGTILGLIGTIAAAGMGGYMYANSGSNPAPAVEQQPPPSFDDSTLQLGLGRLEDYQ